MQEKDFETPDGARAPMDVAEFYDSLETKRMARLDGLVQQYNSIESLLIKVRVNFKYVRPLGHQVAFSLDRQAVAEGRRRHHWLIGNTSPMGRFSHEAKSDARAERRR